MEDAGSPPDAGEDGGSNLPDGGAEEDGGPEPDAGVVVGGSCTHAECTGHQVLICNDGRFVAGENCAASNKRCEGGICTGCLPGFRRCAGQFSIEECTEDGVSFSRIETCQQDQVCNEGRCMAAGPCGGGDKSNQGCDYWAVDLPNADVDVDPGAVSPAFAQYAVIISNTDEARTAQVVITESSGAAPTPVVQDAGVPPGDLRIFNLGPRNADQCGTTMTCANLGYKAYRIQTSIPVVAYQFNPLNNTAKAFSNDASLLLPTNALDKEYIAVTGDALAGSRSSNPFAARVPWGAYISVVGTQDTATSVTVTVPAGVTFDPPQGATVNGSTISASLAKYQVLTVLSRPPNSEMSSGNMVAGGGNLSGARVSASAKVAVFAGNVATLMPHGSTGKCCADHMEEQMFPISSWGKEYVAARSMPRRLANNTSGPEPDYWRITAAENGTTFTYVTNASSGLSGQPASLNAGQSKEFSSTGDFIVSANQPFLLAQFMSSSGQAYDGTQATCNISSPTADDICTSTYRTLSRCQEFQDLFGPVFYCSPVGDPSMTLIPPIRQFRSHYVFLTPLDYKTDFAIIIAPQGTTVTLDGTQVSPSNFVTVGTLGSVTFVRAQIVLSPPGRHVLTASQPIGLLVGGYDRDVSYGYPGGLNLESGPATDGGAPPDGG